MRRCWQLHPIITCLIVVLQAGVVPANDGLDEVLSGFDALEEQEAATDNASDLDSILSGFDVPQAIGQDGQPGDTDVLPGWLDLFGSISLAASWNFAHDPPASDKTDFQGLSMLRTTGRIGTDIKMGTWKARISGHGFYDAAWSVQGRDRYTDNFLEEYEQELTLDDVYLTTSLAGSLDLKIGRQVVVWGKADNVRVTDVLNPLDNKIPGMVDIKYRRLPVTMTRLDYYTGNWNLSGLVLHEIRFDKNPVYNSEFYPADTPPPPEKEPTDFALDTQQYGLALNGIFSGWDFSFYQAWIYDPKTHVIVENSVPAQVHNRVSMTGMTGNVAMGNWLVKGEAAWWHGLEFAAVPDTPYARVDLMAGIEYTGFSETVLSLETVNRHIIDFDARLGQSPDHTPEDLLQTAVMVTRDFANDTIQLKILCSIFGAHGEDGAFERFQIDYDLTDRITLSGGVILYQSGDLIAFRDIGDSDRAFLEYTWSF